MENPMTKWVVAAIVLVTVWIGLWYSGAPIHVSSPAFADVVEQVKTFRPYRCRYRVIENDPNETKGYILEQLSRSQRREIRDNGVILVYDLSIPKQLSLDTKSKQANEHWFDFGPKQDPDLMAIIRSMQNRPVEELGFKMLEGHQVKGFRQTGQANDLTLWADVQTKLPVLFQIIHVQFDRKIIMDQFEFDVEFDEALFSTTAPAGYTVTKTGKGYTDMPKVGEGLPEEPLLSGLKSLAEFFDNEFPPSIDLPKLQQAMRQYTKDHNLSEEEAKTRVGPVSEYWTRAVFYLGGLGRGAKINDFQYRGSGVTFGDANTPILWWQYTDADTYRVIYGDLSIKDLPPDSLPE